MKPSDRINKIYEEEYKKLNLLEKVIVDENPMGELGLRFDAMLKFLDAEYVRERIDNSGSL